MARISISGATIVTPYRTEAELGKVLKELCPEVEFNASEVKNLYWRLGAVVGRWSAEQNRLNALSVARALTAIGKNVAAATGALSAHQTGIHDIRDIEIVSQLKIVLMADPQVGSLQAADKLISSQEEPAKLADACLIAASNLTKQVGKNGRPRFDWYDDFTMMLFQIARRADVEPGLWKDRIEFVWRGWLFEGGQKLEPFLAPEMISESAQACGKRLERSKRRIDGGLN